MEFINESLSFYNVIEKNKTEICEGIYKLCLSPCLLSLLNEAFDSLKSTGKSTPLDIPYEERIILFDLENILKSSSKFKLIQRNIATFAGFCNLQRFSSLKEIEFIRVSLASITGLDRENEINYVSCCRCSNVLELFENDVWSNLKILSLSYCQLTKIQVDCLKNLKSVEKLNLSFNCLKSIDGLSSLTSLRNLDISFNFLEDIPDFGDEPNSALKELYMSNNIITSLAGLSKLVNLTHFDASNNCIYIKEFLVELYNLKYLKWLRLIDNPLCLRKYYRMYVSHFLGIINPPFEFMLDEVPLSDAELDFIGTSKGVAPVINRCLPRTISPVARAVTEASCEIIKETKGILKSSDRRQKKARDVVILDSSQSGDLINTPAASSKTRKTGVVLLEKADCETVKTEPLPASRKTSVSGSSEMKQDALPSKSPKINISNNGRTNQNLKDQSSLSTDNIQKPGYQPDLYSSPESTQSEYRTVEVTVHATQDFHPVTPNELLSPDVNPTKLDHLQSLEDELKEESIEVDDSVLLRSIFNRIGDEIKNEHINLRNSDSLENFTESLDSNDTENVVAENIVDENIITENIIAKNVITENVTTENILTEEESSHPPENETCENLTNDNINNNEMKNAVNNNDKTLEGENSSSEDSAYEDEMNNENLWPVQKIVDSKPVNIFLVLLDSELRERSTISGRTVAIYPLAFVESCTQVKDDPITIELVFSSLLKRTTVRTYVMEFADAQRLINKMNVLLASRPEEIEDQLTSFLCKSCNAFFSVYKTKARTLCTVCGSALVTEVEKPTSEAVKDPLSNSSSQSSIVSSWHAVPENKTSINIDTNPSAVSSGEESEKSEIVNSLYTSTTFQKYESDVEIISNPSQSSIEVIDERDAPSRKRSSEERHVMQSPALPTLEEDVLLSISEVPKLSVSTNGNDTVSDISDENPSKHLASLGEETIIPPPEEKPSIHLTESSSSGSIMTSYEASGAVMDPQVSSVVNEVPEISIEASDISNEAYETCESANQEDETGTPDIYSYSNFTDVDHRIKAFLYQDVFQEDSEELTLLVRCHLWKTGGTDYPACFVLSNKKGYILIHTSSVYGLDASDWLRIQESFDLKSMKRAFPLVWNLGIGLTINRLHYMILLQSKTFSDNLLVAFKGLGLKSCDVGSKASSKVELSLQQVVLTCNYVTDVMDPTILLYTICPTINILKDDELEETMKLGGFVMTANEFYIVLGDFSWLAGSGEPPSIHFFHMMSNLIEVSKRDTIVSLHFLDEKEAVEVVWRLHCANLDQAVALIDHMRAPWENVFAQPLQVSSDSTHPVSSQTISI